jgi:nucleoid-associated protein YgaU
MTAAAISAPASIRLTRRGRLLITVSATLLALGAIFALAIGSAEASNTQNAASIVEVTVFPGDTLWSIAKSVRPEADPRATIYEIKAMNLIEGNTVFPGQVIRISAK